MYFPCRKTRSYYMIIVSFRVIPPGKINNSQFLPKMISPKAFSKVKGYYQKLAHTYMADPTSYWHPLINITIHPCRFIKQTSITITAKGAKQTLTHLGEHIVQDFKVTIMDFCHLLYTIHKPVMMCCNHLHAFLAMH